MKITQSAYMRLAAAIIFAALAYLTGHYLGANQEKNSHVPGPIDVGFIQHMSIHHDQATTLASIVIGKGSKLIDSLALSILTNQMYEIGQMKGWLRLWEQSILPPGTSMDWMTPKTNSYDPEYVEICRASQGGMPGMASQAEINKLRELNGHEMEMMFLALMIRHHEGGLPMLQYAAAHAETNIVKEIAMGMQYEQGVEISQMRNLLAVLALGKESLNRTAKTETKADNPHPL
jgi:uncharacterized protein (DUF305 family)